MGGKNRIGLETIDRWLKDDDWCVRQAAMNACIGRDVPLDMIERGLKDEIWCVRQAAMNACSGRDVPLEVIERGVKDEDCNVRQAAISACAGRDVPLETIDRWLKNKGRRVRKAAMRQLKTQALVSPIIRTIDPPKTVYKKCLAGVIVCATIPEDAQVRGTLTTKCRSDKAVIVDILGDICGEKVGVSIYDCKTMYFVGDEIVVDNFDISDEECSTGFHFFCTLSEAENYG